MLHSIDCDSVSSLVYIVENAVYPYAQTIICRPSEFLCTWRTRVILQPVNVLNDQTDILLG